ncbi:hypothetical protein [Phycicoccus ginsengisoli]
MAAVSGAALSLGCLVVGELLPWLGRFVWGAGQYAPAAPTRSGFGVVVYGLWLLALVLMGAWRVRAGRQLMVATALLAWSAPWVAGVVGESAPPLYFCVVLGFLAVLAAAGEVSPRFGKTRFDVLAVAGVVVLGAVLVGVAARPYILWWTGDPYYAFYRQWPVGLIGVGQVLLWAVPTALLVLFVAAGFRRRLRAWVGPAVVVAVPWMELALLAGAGNTARAGFPAAAVLAAAALIVGVAAFAGLRVSLHAAQALPAQPDAGA